MFRVCFNYGVSLGNTDESELADIQVMTLVV